MTNPSADSAHNGVGDVVLILALPRLVVRRPAVGAAWGISLPQSSIQKSKFAQLIPAQIILTLRHLNSLLNHFHDLLNGTLHGRGVNCGNIRVKWFILSRKRLTILPPDLPLLDASLPPDDDPGPRFLLHGF